MPVPIFLFITVVISIILVLDNRVCTTPFSYVSDLDYLNYALKHSSYSEDRAPEADIQNNNRDTQTTYIENGGRVGRGSLEISQSGLTHYHSYILGNSREIYGWGKEMSVAYDDTLYYIVFSPCGDVLISTL